MVRVQKNLRRAEIARFDVLIRDLDRCRLLLLGKDGRSAYSRDELRIPFDELRKHVDHALRWADEVAWIIETELTPARRAT